MRRELITTSTLVSSHQLLSILLSPLNYLYHPPTLNIICYWPLVFALLCTSLVYSYGGGIATSPCLCSAPGCEGGGGRTFPLINPIYVCSSTWWEERRNSPLLTKPMCSCPLFFLGGGEKVLPPHQSYIYEFHLVHLLYKLMRARG